MVAITRQQTLAQKAQIKGAAAIGARRAKQGGRVPVTTQARRNRNTAATAARKTIRNYENTEKALKTKSKYLNKQLAKTKQAKQNVASLTRQVTAKKRLVSNARNHATTARVRFYEKVGKQRGFYAQKRKNQERILKPYKKVGKKITNVATKAGLYTYRVGSQALGGLGRAVSRGVDYVVGPVNGPPLSRK